MNQDALGCKSIGIEATYINERVKSYAMLSIRLLASRPDPLRKSFECVDEHIDQRADMSIEKRITNLAFFSVFSSCYLDYYSALSRQNTRIKTRQKNETCPCMLLTLGI